MKLAIRGTGTATDGPVDKASCGTYAWLSARGVALSVFVGSVVAALGFGVYFHSQHTRAANFAVPAVVKTKFYAEDISHFVDLSGTSNGLLDNSSTVSPRNPAAFLASEVQAYRQSLRYSSLRPMYILPADGPVSSTFDYRWGTFHTGLDLAAPFGSPIRSVSDAVVIEAGPASGFGLWVRTLAPDGTINVYGHMNTIEVTEGQHVHAGQEIATVGSRGFATGPHLHFEVWKNGKWKVDPAQWLADRGVQLHT